MPRIQSEIVVTAYSLVRKTFVLSLVCASFALTAVSLRAEEPFRFPEGKLGKAELKYRNDLPVLEVEGTPDEMGKQAAVLAVKPAVRILNYPEDVVHAFTRHKVESSVDNVLFKTAWGFFTQTADKMVKGFPDDYKAELNSMIEAGKLDRTKALVGNTMFDAKSKLVELRKGFGCSTLFVEAKRTAAGKPLYGRNLDFSTAGYLNEYSLVTIYRPKGKHSFASIGFPGVIGCLSGMNDAGLTVAVLEVYDTKEEVTQFDDAGIPYAMCMRRLLEECTTIEQAEKLLRGMKRTTILNVAVGDVDHAAVFEFTPKSLVVRKSQDQMCICTNHFRTEELCTDTKCYRYDRLAQCEDKVDLETLAKRLDRANQGANTLQTMIFEPATLTLHLAIGKCPTSALPMKTLELKELFAKP
jgi:hypothetical protein